MSDLLSPKDIVRSGLCIGCGSCVAQANLPDTQMKWDGQGFLKPGGNREWYRQKSESFTRTCPFSPSAKNEDFLAAERFPNPANRTALLGSFEAGYVGHVAEE